MSNSLKFPTKFNRNKVLPLGLVSGLFLLASAVQAQVFLSPEFNAIWQSRNEFRIPGTTGTRVSIVEADKGPFWGYRVYGGFGWGGGSHEVRALYAPLGVEANTQFAATTDFFGESFAAATDSTVFYKFNSYRLGYMYNFNPTSGWVWGLGFTGKIRDAEIRVSQGTQVASKKNVGFVPLLRLQVLGTLGESSRLRFDVDGLAAPQGRAFDATIRIEQYLTHFGAGHSLWGFLGYRTVEGGADNDEVYNFAWFHSLSAGVFASF